MKQASAQSEKGAALLIVLLLVATLSVVSLTIVQTVGQAYRVGLHSSARSQALWYAMGTETLATSRLTQLMKLSEGKLSRNMEGLNEPFTFVIDGGSLTVQVADYSNCFNLNSLGQVTEEAGENTSNAVSPALFYEHLLGALEIDTSLIPNLVAGVEDWIDADTRPRLTGAETSYYATLPQPYAPGDSLMATPQELLGIKGYTPDIFRRIRPFVCALPGKTPGVFNVNTLNANHAPLLVPVFGNEIDVEKIRTELEAGSNVTFKSASEFLALPTFALITPEKRQDQFLGIDSTYFRLTGEVVYLDTLTRYEAVFVRNDANKITLVRRRLGVDE